MPASWSAKTLSLVETSCALCGAREAEAVAAGFDYEYRTAANQFTFVRCSGCGHVYLNPRPSSADLDVIYPPTYYSLAGPTNPLVARAQRVWEGRKVAAYRELVGDGPRRILEVGCGNGRFLSILREFGPSEWELVGIDFDAKAVEQCRARGFEAHVARAEDFREGDGTFDAVIMLQLIEHVEDPAELSARVYRLLKPGGAFVIETPNLAGLDYALFRRWCWGHYHFPRHWNLFSSESLHRMLAGKGFEIARTDYLISTSAWTISLHNYFFAKGWPDWFVRRMSYQSPLLLPVFVVLDWLRARLGAQTSNQRVIARKPH